MFLSLYDEVTSVLCVSLSSHDRYQYHSLILSKQTRAYPRQFCFSDVKGTDVALMSRKNAWKEIFMFPVRYYANCVSTTLTVLITLKVSISFIVTLYIQQDATILTWLLFQELCMFRALTMPIIRSTLLHRQPLG
jgi:hypothetical protein